MQFVNRRFAVWVFSLVAAFYGLAASPAFAQAPRPWEMNMQPAFSPMKREIITLHNEVLIIITLITLLSPRCLDGFAIAITRSAIRCPV
jgi:hypothetical protein